MLRAFPCKCKNEISLTAFLKKKFSTFTILSKSPTWLSWMHSHPWTVSISNEFISYSSDFLSQALNRYLIVESFQFTALLVPIICFLHIHLFHLTSKVFLLAAAVQAEISSCYSNIGFEIPTLDCDKAFV